VKLPEIARSALTKFRWKQGFEQASGNVSRWGLDDVGIDVEAANPAVQISVPLQSQSRSKSLITVVIQITQPVEGFDAEDVKVQNGTHHAPFQSPLIRIPYFCFLFCYVA
jgi:hypothetical protein